MTWRDEAQCQGIEPELFFDDARVEIARGYCLACPVRHPCLMEALADRWSEGVWGGTTKDQRAAIRRKARRLYSMPPLRIRNKETRERRI